MNIYSKVFATLLIVGGLSIGISAQAAVTSPDVEAAATAPRKATVTWEAPDQVAEEGLTVSSWELDLSEDVDFTSVDTFSFAADVVEVNLTRDHGLRGMKHYYVRVRALYTDETMSQYGSTNFYTQIGKLDELRVAQDSAVGTVTMKWQKPSREGNQLTYNLRLFRKGNLVYKASVYGKNNITATGLKAGKKYKFKVRARQDSTYGTGKWSDLKAFRVQEAE